MRLPGSLMSYSMLALSLLACELGDDQLGTGGPVSSGPGDGDPGDGESGDGDGDPGGSEGEGNSAGEGGDGDGDGEPCEPYPTTEVPECPDVIGEGFCSEGREHVDIGTEITWMHNPPHSGPHFPVWSSWGEKLEPVERGYWVHNLEHGGIVVVYNCAEPCEDELDIVREAMAARPEHDVLLTPDPLLEGSRFAALSWTWVHAFDEPVLEDLVCFVDQHYDNSPEIVH